MTRDIKTRIASMVLLMLALLPFVFQCGAAVLLAGLMQRTKLMLCRLGGGRCYCAAGKDAARQTELAHRWPSS